MTGWLGGALARRLPTLLLLLGLAVVGAVRLAVFVVGRWWLLWPVLVLALAWRFGPATLARVVILSAVVVGVGLAGWAAFAPSSWSTRVDGPVRGWFRHRRYRAAWDDAVDGCGLVRAGVTPTLMSCRVAGGVDRLLVHLAPGQVVADWRDVAPRVASALGVRSVRVRSAGPRDVTLLVRWREVRRHDPITGPELEAEVIETAGQPQPEGESLDQLAERIVAELPEPTEVRAGAFPRRPR